MILACPRFCSIFASFEELARRFVSQRCTTCGSTFEDSVDLCPRDGTPLFATAYEESDGEFNEELNQSNDVVTSVGAHEEAAEREAPENGQTQAPIDDPTELIQRPDQQALERAIRASAAPERLSEETSPGEDAAQFDAGDEPQELEPHEDSSEELLLDQVAEEPAGGSVDEPEPTEPGVDEEADLSNELPAFEAPSQPEPDPAVQEPEPQSQEESVAVEEPEPALEEESDEVLDLEDLKSLTVSAGSPGPPPLGPPSSEPEEPEEPAMRGTQHGIPVNMEDDEPGFVPTPAQGTRPEMVEESPDFNDFDDGGFSVPESAPHIDTPPMEEHSEPAMITMPNQPSAEIPGLEASVEPISEGAAEQPPVEATPAKKSGGTLFLVVFLVLVVVFAAGVALAFSMGMIQL